MNESGGERSKPWNIYTSAELSPSQSGNDIQSPWKSYGTSMNAISFGFVATAILITMFLVMAIFEHLLRPPEGLTNSSLESGQMHKLENPQSVSTSYASDFSVMMPGQHCPTHIAQPAPLPCPREAIYWPPHEHTFVFP